MTEEHKPEHEYRHGTNTITLTNRIMAAGMATSMI
jgi:hypothetical protein